MTDHALTVRPDATLTSGQILAGLHTVASVLAPELNADELKLFAMVAARSGLDPFAKQIYAVKRKGRVTFQTGIDGYRSIAARTGLYDGQDEPEFGPVCECGDNRPAGHPEYAVVRVYRKGVGRPIAARADWHEYKPDAGERGTGDAMWTRMPKVMLAKVAEALALRKAFPYDPENRQGIGADVYTTDEMAQADRSAPAQPAPTARDRIAARAASARTAADAGAAPGGVASVANPAPAGAPGPSVAVTGGPMTREEFFGALRAAGITSGPYIDAVGEELFGGRLDLTDEERGMFAAELVRRSHELEGDAS